MVGPAGQVMAKMTPAEMEQLKAHLRPNLPGAPEGTIAYEAFANAVKGIVPAQRPIAAQPGCARPS